VAAPEHEGAGPHERGGEPHRRRVREHRSEDRREEQGTRRETQTNGGPASADAPGTERCARGGPAPVGCRDRLGPAPCDPAGEPAEQDGDDLRRCNRPGQEQGGGGGRQEQPRRIGRETTAHRDDRMGDDGDGCRLEPGDRTGEGPGLGQRRPRDEQPGEGHEHRARQREAQEGGQGAGPPRADPADADRQLAAGGAGQRLAHGHELRERVVVEPPQPIDERRALISQVRDRTAERGQPEAQRCDEDLAHGARDRGVSHIRRGPQRRRARGSRHVPGYAVSGSGLSGSRPSSRIAFAAAFGSSSPHWTSPVYAAATMCGVSIPNHARRFSRVSLRP
jgi:hypothetical protein